MKISKFNNSLMYSNKNMEKMMRQLVNESCNAVLMETFNDKCILADHKTGNVYSSDYSFDGKVLTFENFEQIELEKDTENLEEAIGKFFNDEQVDLAEAYEESSSFTKDVFEESLVEALASKNMEDIIDYSQLEGINEEIGELKDSKMYGIYEARINESPMSSIKMFDWVNPVKVCLIDEDEGVLVSSDAIAKAKSFKTNKEFKKELMEAAKEAMEGNDYILENFVEDNRAIVSLDKAGLKELVGMSVIGSKELMESRNEIVDKINTIIDENEDLTYYKNMINEEDEEEASAKAECECSEKDCEALKKALEKAQDKVTDEKLLKKISDLIDDIDNCKDTETTDVGTVKECISLLSL